MGNIVWTGLNATDAKWSRTDNWDLGRAPTTDDALFFAGTTRLSTTNDIAADTSFASITFNSGAGAFTLAGNRITLTGAITNNASNAQTISLNIITTAARSVNCASGNITISGVISGSGGGLTKETGTNKLTISGINTCTGTITVSAGTMSMTSPNQSSSGWHDTTAITINNGGTISIDTDNALLGYTVATTPTITINSGGTLAITSNYAQCLSAVSLAGGAMTSVTARTDWGNWLFDKGLTTTNASTTSTISGGGWVVIRSSSTFDVSANDTVECSSIIANASSATETSLTKTGAGILILSATGNTYATTTAVNGGTLSVTGTITGTGAISVANTATLGGTGTVAGAITQSSGSIIAPGTGTTTIGTLGTANVTMDAGSTYSVNLNGTTPTFDKINSSGTVACAGTLTIASIANRAKNKSYTIIEAASVTGTFANLPNKTTFTQQGSRFRIIYSATTVILTDVSNWLNNIIYYCKRRILGRPLAWTTSSGYTFTAASSNLLLGLSPSANTNVVGGYEGTGPVTVLTDGLATPDAAHTYTIGYADITYDLPGTTGCDITAINVYTRWGDANRSNIDLYNFYYSLISDPTTFIELPSSSVNYVTSATTGKGVLIGTNGLILAKAYAIRFKFGPPQNGYVGWVELEVIGSVSS